MAQNKNSRKSDVGLCQKIHNAVNHFRSRIRRIPHQPQGSISITSDEKPVHVLQQSSLNKMIPVEFNHFSAQNSKKLVALSPVVQSAERENSTRKPVQEFGERDIVIVRSQKFAKAASRKKENDSIHEGKFSDYINKVKNRMVKTASNVEKSLSLK